MAHSLARLLFQQPVGPRELTLERHRALARVRALIMGGAILVDLLIWGVLGGDPAIRPGVLVWFLKINVPLLVLDAAVALAMSRWASARIFVPVTIVCVLVEVFTSMVWVQVSGSVSAYSIALPLVLIIFYRIGYDLRLGLVAFLSALVLHVAIVALELRHVLSPEALFVGEVGRIYGSAGFVWSSMLSIASLYAFALFVPNYIMNRLHQKDLELEVARDQARHGRHSGRLLAGRYRLGEVIGRGGMGEVYQARDEHDRRDCAVKVLHPHLIGETRSLRRFQREAEVAGQLGSPHIVELYETGTTDDGLPFIALELLAGEDLGQRLRRTGPMAPEELVPLAAQVAAGLEVAHAADIVHRDLKPQNLFLVGDPAAPTVKILDFGVCKIRGDSEGLTRTADIIGTPGFMAPEQILGGRDAVDRRADIFALGAILYRALTGVLPFGGGDLTRVIYRVAHEHPALPSFVRPDLPGDIDAVLAIALAKQPVERYAGVADLAQDFAAAVTASLSRERREQAAPLLQRVRHAHFPAERDQDALAATVEVTGEE